MKPLSYFFFCLLFIGVGMTASAQCDIKVYTSQALDALPQNFNLVKTYRVDGLKGERKRIEHSLILNSNTEYSVRVISADGGAKGLVATLYDAKHQMITTTFVSNQYLKGFTYKCPMAGRYFLVFSFEGSESYCGAASLGFKYGNSTP